MDYIDSYSDHEGGLGKAIGVGDICMQDLERLDVPCHLCVRYGLAHNKTL